MKTTRKQSAIVLYKRVKYGPATIYDKGSEALVHDYKCWSETWILPELERLIPELKNYEATQKENEIRDREQTSTPVGNRAHTRKR